jgi:hypothetical protein
MDTLPQKGGRTMHYGGQWYPWLQTPPRLAARMALLPPLGLPARGAPYGGVTFPLVGRGGAPILGRLNPFQYGPAAIDPGELFFRAGNPIGGPSEGYRGLSATVFPFYVSILGPGAPLSPDAFGLAGAAMVAPGRAGSPFPQ